MMFMWTPELYIARQRRALAWKVVAIIGLLPLLALAIWLLLLVTEHYFSYLHNTSMGGFYRNYAFFIGWMEPLLAAVFLVAVLIGIVAVICFATGNYKKMRLDGEALYFEIYKLNARIDSRIKSLRSSSLVLGILSLALLPLLITWPACAVLGIVGIAHAQELYVMTRTYTAGLVTSIIGVVVSVFLILMLIASLFLTV
jgi:hypothetical protein